MALTYFDLDEPKIRIGFMIDGQFAAYRLEGAPKPMAFDSAEAAHAQLDNLCREYEKDLRVEGWYVADADFNPIARRPSKVRRKAA